VSGRQVISPQAHEGRGKRLPPHYTVPKPEGEGAMQALGSTCPNGKLPTLAIVTRQAPNRHIK
jgi:hypothetical protein